MTQEIVKTGAVSIPAMDIQSIGMVSDLQRLGLTLPQIDPDTQHLFHAGMYHRTVRMPANTVMTGVLIKIPTIVTVCGDVSVFLGDYMGLMWKRLTGYHVVAAQPNRKQAFVAHEATFVTMSFATQAKTVEEVENEFTDEADLLMTRRGFSNEVHRAGD